MPACALLAPSCCWTRSTSWGGTAGGTLLEVLDPEKNHSFMDTYLGVPFNLAAVTFLATANKASDIPAPLLDRLEEPPPPPPSRDPPPASHNPLAA